MDAPAVLAASFENLHEAMRADVAELDPAWLWWQPREGLNHIGFLLWHVVRDEDAVVAHVAGRPELWTEGWRERLAVDRVDQGTGLDAAALPDFRFELPAFLEYAEAVWARTGPAVASLAAERLSAPAWPDSDWSVARLLTEGCCSHGWMHLGEVRYIKGLLGWRGHE